MEKKSGIHRTFNVHFGIDLIRSLQQFKSHLNPGIFFSEIYVDLSICHKVTAILY